MSAAPFVAPFWLTNAHLQTIYGSVCARAPRVAFRRERWDTPDGDFVDVDFVDGVPGSPWVLLFHGLEGSSDSSYARMLMAHVRRRGWHGCVFHFRGCSGEPNRVARAYHSGDSDEVDWGLRRVKKLAERSTLYAVGVSLGGNALAKWLGENRGGALRWVARAAVISAPLDLMAAGDALGRGFARVYSWHFLDTLKRSSLEKLTRFPNLFDAEAVRRATSLRDFDNVVTAPLHGFKDTDDYWTRASAKPHLKAIRVPTLIVNARDDPFLPAEFLPDGDDVSADVTLELPRHGGHVAFVSGPFPGNIEWLPRRILTFFNDRV